MTICFSTYLTKISNFYSYKKNLDFTVIIHLINIILRYENNNIRILTISNILNRFTLASSNYSNTKFNLSILKEISLVIIQEFIPKNLLNFAAIENFSNFLSFFISNQEFNFQYEKIKQNYPVNSPSAASIEFFSQNLIDKLCSIGSKGKIMGFLPDNLKCYLPEDDKPFWK